MSSSLAGLAAYTIAARGHSMPVNRHHADPLTPPAPCNTQHKTLDAILACADCATLLDNAPITR